MTTTSDATRQPVQTVNKALSVLELFKPDVEWLGVREISRTLSLNSATVHNILRTLSHSGFVEQDENTKKYRLGLKVVQLAGAKLAQMDLVSSSADHMKQLKDVTNETITLSVLHEGQLLYLAKLESSEPVRVASHVGGSAPLHCSANGKAILAYLPDPPSILPPRLHRYTDRTVVDPSELKLELDAIRQQGFALDVGGYLEDVNAVGAPIFAETRGVIGSIAVVGPASRMDEAKLQLCMGHVRNAAANISRALGWSGTSARPLSL